ncbi:hypothetical protein M422DRAFT_258180 [Sphaerobolus stellatus SS14]|uniref:Uncharacterized protein n=1 Tax=Sphaerobolus stellatus (strain SS14) TaxID=990650 RepID=A0A0C9VM90_SPHS4|nr:hypothetical protein M422DRAFT_258180 [Sphaerobolus stellatus SS14]
MISSELFAATIPSTPVRQKTFSVHGISPNTPSTTPITNSTSSHHSLVSTYTSPLSAPQSPVSDSAPKSTNQSPADLADNWRARAQQNGIKVDTEDGNVHQGKYYATLVSRLLK